MEPARPADPYLRENAAVIATGEGQSASAATPLVGLWPCAMPVILRCERNEPRGCWLVRPGRRPSRAAASPPQGDGTTAEIAMTKGGKADKWAARSVRLSAALRENLKRRKEQARARVRGEEPRPEPSPKETGKEASHDAASDSPRVKPKT